MSSLYLITLGFVIVLSLTYVIYLLYGMWSAAPFVPTTKEPARTMLALADIKAGECVIDLGSGDGRLVFAAAAAGAQAIGVEINPLLYLWSVIKAKLTRQPRAAFRRENLWRTDLSPADVLTIYCLPGKMERLAKKIKDEMRPGARIIVYEFPFPNWQYEKKDGKVYLYVLYSHRRCLSA